MGSSAICPNSGKTCGARWGCDGAHRFAKAGTLMGKGDGRCARDRLAGADSATSTLDGVGFRARRS